MVATGESHGREDSSPVTREGSAQLRDLSVDRLRGALVVLMVIGDYLSGIQAVPAFLKHAPDIGLTVADLVAPAFVFIIGLNYGGSFLKRSQSSVTSAYRYFLWRYLGLIGIGAVIVAGGTMVGRPTDWGVLQAIGVAGLICLLVIRLSTTWRFVIGMALLGGYQYLLDQVMLQTVLNSVHGGLFGALSWAALLILSTAVADVWRKGFAPFLPCTGLLVVAAALSTLVVPVSKHRVSLSYILITLALSAAVFLALKAIDRFRQWKPGILCWWGQNALALYLIHLVFVGVFAVPPAPWWYAEVSVWLGALQLVAILASMSWVAWTMSRRRGRLEAEPMTAAEKT